MMHHCSELSSVCESLSPLPPGSWDQQTLGDQQRCQKTCWSWTTMLWFLKERIISNSVTGWNGNSLEKMLGATVVFLHYEALEQNVGTAKLISWDLFFSEDYLFALVSGDAHCISIREDRRVLKYSNLTWCNQDIKLTLSFQLQVGAAENPDLQIPNITEHVSPPQDAG